MSLESDVDRALGTLQKRFTLLEIYDLRETDWMTGKKVPLMEGEGSECMRCGRLHAVVWVVRDNQTGKEWKVGSGCGPKALGGWKPEADEVKKVKKEMRKRAEERRLAKIETEAQRIAAEVAALTSPSVTTEPLGYDPGLKYICGDASIYAHEWDNRSAAEHTERARWSWLYNRIEERSKGYADAVRMAIKERAGIIVRKKIGARGGKRRHAPSRSRRSR